MADDFFKVPYAKLGITDTLFYLDQTGNERKSTCDYAVMISVTIDGSNGNIVCGFNIRQGKKLLTRYYPAEDFLTQTSGKTALVKKLSKLGFDLGDLSEAEFIASKKEEYRDLRENPYYTSNCRGWVTENGARLYITNVVHGADFPCSPHMNPAFAPHPSGSLDDFLKGINDLAIGHRPTEIALSLALGAPLFSLFQDRLANDAVCVGLVSSTSRGKTTLLNFLTAVLANPYFIPDVDVENDEVLPAKFDLNCTSNYLFGALNRIRGVAVGLDDFTAGIIRDTEQVLYQLALGSEKGRANSEGKSKKRNRFQTYFFINAERSLINLETNGGIFRRYLECRDLECCKDAVHSIALAALSRNHYATLGNDYIARFMQLDDNYLIGLSDYCHDKLKAELDSFNLKDANARYALAKSLCYLPASLALFNQFYATGENAPCKAIDVDGFIKWLAIMIANNTRENAVYFNFAADIELLKEIILPRFYCRLSDSFGDILNDPISNTDPKKYAYSLADIPFDSYDSLDIYDDPNTLNKVGRKRDGKLAIQTGAFASVYNSYIRACNDNSAVKNRKSCTQFLKELKLNGVLDFDYGKDDKRLTRKIALINDGDLSCDFEFETGCAPAGGITFTPRRCYVFNLAPGVIATPDIESDSETQNGVSGGGL